MKATLLIPCYNAARFLPRLMENVRRQSMPFTAILCYDDGSTDDTVAVARSLSLEIMTGEPNRGVAHARNRLVQASQTEWIHFHDADDLISPSYLEEIAPGCIAQNDVVSCDADWVEEDTGDVTIRWRYDPVALSTRPYPYLLQHAMGLNNSIIRKSIWDKIGGCDPRLAMWEDSDLHIRLGRAGARFFHVPKVLTWSMRRQDSFSHDYRRNWMYRVQALEGYALAEDNPAVRRVIAGEAEIAATTLVMLDDHPTAERALSLCRLLGGSPPTSRSCWIRLLKPFIPAFTLIRWQQRWRRRAKAVPSGP